MAPASANAMVQHFVEKCREAGMPATPQRIEIFRALASSHQHPTPEMVSAAASMKLSVTVP